MNSMTSQPNPDGTPRRPPRKKPLYAVDFFCRAPKAKSVSLICDFNEWNPAANPMRKMPDGGWVLRVSLPQGHQRYLFVVDGKPTLDPNALGKVYNERNEPVSLVAVS